MIGTRLLVAATTLFLFSGAAPPLSVPASHFIVDRGDEGYIVPNRLIVMREEDYPRVAKSFVAESTVS